MPNVPVLLLGGGGYNEYNVARCWTALTHAAAEQPLPSNVPGHDYFENYSPDFSFNIRPSYRRFLSPSVACIALVLKKRAPSDATL